MPKSLSMFVNSAIVNEVGILTCSMNKLNWMIAFWKNKWEQNYFGIMTMSWSCGWITSPNFPVWHAILVKIRIIFANSNRIAPLIKLNFGHPGYHNMLHDHWPCKHCTVAGKSTRAQTLHGTLLTPWKSLSTINLSQNKQTRLIKFIGSALSNGWPDIGTIQWRECSLIM